MSIIQSILLGILQGIAEFLPISSSGHLKVCEKLFGLSDVPLLYDVVLHLATLLAVCIFFRKQICKLFCILGRWITRRPQPETIDDEDLISGTDARGRKTIIAVIISTIITGAIGIVTSKLIDDNTISVKIVCAGFIVTACLLVVSSLLEKRAQKSITPEKAENQKKGISWLQAVVIGIMQGIGTLPGISRSGSTIAGAQLSGVNRTAAGEYSFIVSIPAVLGAFILELKKYLKGDDAAKLAQKAADMAPAVTDAANSAPQIADSAAAVSAQLQQASAQVTDAAASGSISTACIIAGVIAAFIFGYLSLTVLMKLIKKGKLEWFACYLIPAGILGIILL